MARLIVVDATPYGPEPSGAKRRAVEMLRRLPAMLPDDVFEVHWAKDGGGPPKDLVADNLVHATVPVSCRGGALRWLSRARALKRRHREAAYTHLLVDHGPVVLPGKVRTVVTVHDLRFMHGYGGLARRSYGTFRYGRLLRRAASVVAVAPNVRADLVARFHLDPPPVLSRNAASPVFARRPPRAVADAVARYGIAGDYLLVVARAERRKAIPAAVAAWRAGGAGGGRTLDLVIVGDRAPTGRGIVLARDVPEDDLAALYSGARFTLVPSRYEGYSLPVAESLACGTPVIASDIDAHQDFAVEGAQGLLLVPPPRRTFKGWAWPGAVAALSRPPPALVRGSPATWDGAASALASCL